MRLVLVALAGNPDREVVYLGGEFISEFSLELHMFVIGQKDVLKLSIRFLGFPFRPLFEFGLDWI